MIAIQKLMIMHHDLLTIILSVFFSNPSICSTKLLKLFYENKASGSPEVPEMREFSLWNQKRRTLMSAVLLCQSKYSFSATVQVYYQRKKLIIHTICFPTVNTHDLQLYCTEAFRGSILIVTIILKGFFFPVPNF